MQRSVPRHVLWEGNRTLYDTATETALRERLADRGWVVDVAESPAATHRRRLDPFALVHCWDLSAIGTWLPTLRAAREAGIDAVLSPTYDEEYVARSRQRTLDPASPTPFPDQTDAWRFTRMQQQFAFTQVRMLLLTTHAELGAIHHAFPESRRIPPAVVPACVADPSSPASVAPSALPSVEPYALCVAPVSFVNGQADIIRAARGAGLIPVMIGMAAPEDAEYERQCREVAPETIWLPALSVPQLAAAIRGARVVVHPARDVVVPLLAGRHGVRVALPATHPARECLGEAALTYRRSDPVSLDVAVHAAGGDVEQARADIDTAASLDAAATRLAEVYEAIATPGSRNVVPREGVPYVRFLEAELIREYRANRMPDAVIATLEAEVTWYRRIAEEGAPLSELRRAEQVTKETHALAHERFEHIRRLEAILAATQESAEQLGATLERTERLLAEETARVRAEEQARVRAEEQARVRQQEAARLLAEETARVRQEEDRAASLAEEVAWRRQVMEDLTAELTRQQAFLEMRIRAGISRARDRARQLRSGT